MDEQIRFRWDHRISQSGIQVTYCFLSCLFLISCMETEVPLSTVSDPTPLPTSSPPPQIDPLPTPRPSQNPVQNTDPSKCLSYPFLDCAPLVPYENFSAADQADYHYLDPATYPNFDSSQRIQYRAPRRYLDLSQLDSELSISPHFTLGEFLKIRNGRYGFFSRSALSRLESIRNALNRPMIINSGYRSPAFNQSIDAAAKWSRHMYGDAVDIHASETSYKKALQTQCIEKGAGFTLLYATHIHCDWRKDSLDSHFYDPPSTSTRDPSTEIRNSRSQLAREAQSLLKAQIHISTSTGQNQWWITLNNPESTEGEPLLEWVVFYKNGTIFESEGEHLSNLGPLENIEKIEVTVGGVIDLEWKPEQE